MEDGKLRVSGSAGVFKAIWPLGHGEGLYGAGGAEGTLAQHEAE